MTDPVNRLVAAEIEATLARERLSSTLAVLQARLAPKRLARRAVDEVTDAGTTAAKVGVATARRNPAALAGLAGIVGLFLARHRLAGLVRGRKRRETDDRPTS